MSTNIIMTDNLNPEHFEIAYGQISVIGGVGGSTGEPGVQVDLVKVNDITGQYMGSLLNMPNDISVKVVGSGTVSGGDEISQEELNKIEVLLIAHLFMYASLKPIPTILYEAVVNEYKSSQVLRSMLCSEMLQYMNDPNTRYIITGNTGNSIYEILTLKSDFITKEEALAKAIEVYPDATSMHGWVINAA